ncbi:MAG TPA: hypothetical protein VHY48_01540 [Acidobacteriaceae bacterium]|nr:hypothetical protein [Acidobacteriaceae bacterium]
MKRWIWALAVVGGWCFVASAWAQGGVVARRMVVIDQDGAGPGGSDQMSMLLLLQSPDEGGKMRAASGKAGPSASRCSASG